MQVERARKRWPVWHDRDDALVFELVPDAVTTSRPPSRIPGVANRAHGRAPDAEALTGVPSPVCGIRAFHTEDRRYGPRDNEQHGDQGGI